MLCGSSRGGAAILPEAPPDFELSRIAGLPLRFWRETSIKAMPPSLSGTVLKKKWTLGALVGKGGCAEVYEAIGTGDAERAGAGPFVAKVAPLAVGLPPAMSKGKKRKKTEQEKHADMIYYEYTLYKGFLADHGGVAEVRT